MSASPAKPAILIAAQHLAQTHHANYDPSHDLHHVQRVRLLSLSIARSLSPQPDLLVVELAALFHDLLDTKYLPPRASTKARDVLKGFWEQHGHQVEDDRRTLTEKVVENVSYSKEKKRISEGKQTEWHETCTELHCVQDADKLDAIGAFGILRCAAYSAITSRPLYLPSAPPSLSTSDPDLLPRNSTDDSAIAHFHDKLFHLQGMMKTPKGRELARKRTETMRSFVGEVEREWAEAVGEQSGVGCAVSQEGSETE
ncbi:hypothetical protein JCM11641_003205 [Rhodosporidiobolus odoratus]